MLASCLALTNSLSWTSITRHRLLTLILTLNLYEAALLAIGLFLITRRGLRRDGGMLLVLQAFFLADFSFLNAEVNERRGWSVNSYGTKWGPGLACSSSESTGGSCESLMTSLLGGCNDYKYDGIID